MIINLGKALLICLAFSFALSTYAQTTDSNHTAHFFDQRYRGWLWFEEREEEEGPLEDELHMPSIVEMEQAKKENEEFAKELELLKHMMIRYPKNLHYVTLYRMKEKEMMDNAGHLGKSWIMTSFLNPDMIDQLENPQNLYGRNVVRDEEQKNRKRLLASLIPKIELFIFRKDNCEHCSVLEKHFANFLLKYNFSVEAVSADTSKSKYFKTTSSPALIQALKLEVVPTIIAVIKDSRERFEIVRGAVSITEIEDNLLNMMEYLDRRKNNASQIKDQNL